MRIVDPNKRNGPAMPGLPAWYKEWLIKYGKYVELKCGCIQDLNLPSCITMLTNKPEIECGSYPSHGFQPIKRSLKSKEVIRIRLGVEIPDEPDGLFPPF